MANYYICPVCTEPIEVENYAEHFEKHGKKEKYRDSRILERILEDAEKSWKLKGNNNVLSLHFEISRRILSEVEKIDTSSWVYLFDYDIPHIMSNVQPSVPSPYPPVMCHIRFKIKDKEKFEQLLAKHEEVTEEMQLLKEIVSTNMPVVVVYGKEWSRLVLQWKSEGKPSSDFMMLTVYFFLHEMYHILGFGEKNSTTKASVAMYRIFGQMVGIPEHEIERWKYEEEHEKEESENC